MLMKLVDRIQLSGKYQFMFGYPYHQIGIDRQHPIPSAARGAQPASGGRQGGAARPADDGGREGRGGPPAREAGSAGNDAGEGGREGRRGPPTMEAQRGGTDHRRGRQGATATRGRQGAVAQLLVSKTMGVRERRGGRGRRDSSEYGGARLGIKGEGVRAGPIPVGIEFHFQFQIP